MSQQWMLCGEWVPSEWESDKNITIIHRSPVHQLTSGEDKSWDKSIIKTFLTKIPVHNYSSSGEKSGLVWIRREICTDQTSFIITIALNNYCDVLISSLNSHSDGTHSLQRIRRPDNKRIFSKYSFLAELFLSVLEVYMSYRSLNSGN